MNRRLQKKDFIIKDLVVSIAGGSHGGAWLPGPDGETPPSPISPVASVLVNMDIIESVRATIMNAMETKEGLESIGEAFLQGEAGGNAAIRSAIYKIGSAVVASAAYSAMGGGSVGLPNPECGGTSLETIPPTLTPIINVGRKVHRITELPRLRQQLAVTSKYIDQVAAKQAPVGEEIGMIREQLERALKHLG